MKVKLNPDLWLIDQFEIGGVIYKQGDVFETTDPAALEHTTVRGDEQIPTLVPADPNETLSDADLEPPVTKTAGKAAK